jgi:single-stranded-DNA-specific exonuclease
MTQSKKVAEKKPLCTNNVHSDPLLNKIYQNRGVAKCEDLEYGLAKLLPPWSMKDIDKAVDKIIEHIYKKSNILIVGDYDCDGATSTTIAVEGLLMCGASCVDLVVPDRIIHGYGLSPSLVDDIESKKITNMTPDLIITVDNGVSAFEGADAVANMKHKCELVITDHHLANAEGLLPTSHAIVNPNRIDCDFPSKNIAGCGVMFYVIMALRSKMEASGDFIKLGIKKPDIRVLLDVLTLGTIADVVTLDFNNRVIVSAGLSMMRKGIVRPGIQALLDVAGRKIEELVASDMGFTVGPRINAAGRMSDMSIGISCLMSKNYDDAIQIARELDFLNRQRREVEQQMVTEANLNPEYDSTKFGITILGEGWHEGVVGIVSSRIKEKANRPVICFTNSEPHNGRDVIKGSARSVAGIHLKHILVEIESVNSDIFIKFGGHAMAAGMSIYAEYYEEFSRLFDERVKSHITQDILDGLTLVDIEDMPEDYLNIQKAYLLEANGPWGQNFEEPVFAGIFDVIDTSPIKVKHLRLELQKGSIRVGGIWFNCIDETYLDNPFTGKVKVVFTMSINRFRGKETLQLMVRHLEPVKMEELPVSEDHTVNISSLSRRKRSFDETCLNTGTGDIINQVLNRK